MTKPDPESKTPPAKVLLPLGALFIILPILCIAKLELDPVSGVMMIVLILMGLGMLWQGTKNLRR